MSLYERSNPPSTNPSTLRVTDYLLGLYDYNHCNIIMFVFLNSFPLEMVCVYIVHKCYYNHYTRPHLLGTRCTLTYRQHVHHVLIGNTFLSQPMPVLIAPAPALSSVILKNSGPSSRRLWTEASVLIEYLTSSLGVLEEN